MPRPPAAAVSTTSPLGSSRWAGAALPVAIALLTALVVVAVTGGDPLAVPLGLVLDGWPVLLWLVAAAGFGRLTGRGLLGPAPAGGPERVDRIWVDLALGAAVTLALDGLVFRLVASPAAAWIITAAGGMAALAGFGPALLRRGPGHLGESRTPAAQMVRGLGAIAGGVLLAAALAAPGLLWRSEFNGYDALSYHLPLPAAWAAAGRSAPIETIAYGWMPNAVEHAFLHMGLLRGDMRAAGTTAQLLHAAFAIAAAVTTGRVAAALVRRAGARSDAALGGAIAAALVLATPWTVVTGSLAYTEMAVLWMLAASMLVALRRTGRPAGHGAAHGLLLAAAVAAKLTAAPLALLPAAAWWWTIRPRRRDRRGVRIAALVGGGGLVGTLVLAPWAIANVVATGNPVFPFATGRFGPGPWTAEQVDAWTRGHRGGAGLSDLWTAWLGQGLDGAAPAQWGLLPVAGLLAAAGLAAASGGRFRRVAVGIVAMLAIQLVLWATLTHAQARFLLPTAVPLAIAAAGAICLVARRHPSAATAGAAALLAGQLAILAVVVHGERPMARPDLGLGFTLGRTELLRGDRHEEAMADARRRGDRPAMNDLRQTAPASWWINHALPPGARVLLIGEAAVWPFDPDRIAWRTVWDRDELTSWLDAEDAASPSAAPWPESAAAAGFTHVLVNQAMLANWADPARRWNDPRMTWADLSERAGDGLRPIAEPAPGVTLYEIRAGRGD